MMTKQTLMPESTCGVEEIVNELIEHVEGTELPEDFDHAGEFHPLVAHIRHTYTNYDDLGEQLSKHCFDYDTGAVNEKCTRDSEEASECEFCLVARYRLRQAAKGKAIALYLARRAEKRGNMTGG